MNQGIQAFIFLVKDICNYSWTLAPRQRRRSKMSVGVR